jgi:hypothetical protein
VEETHWGTWGRMENAIRSSYAGWAGYWAADYRETEFWRANDFQNEILVLTSEKTFRFLLSKRVFIICFRNEFSLFAFKTSFKYLPSKRVVIFCFPDEFSSLTFKTSFHQLLSKRVFAKHACVFQRCFRGSPDLLLSEAVACRTFTFVY